MIKTQLAVNTPELNPPKTSQSPPSTPVPTEHKRIKSFVMRPGRMTTGQKVAVEQLWVQKGLNIRDGQLDAEQVFNRKAALVLEIGFGMGQSLIDMCRLQPEKNFVGVEVHLPGVGRTLNEMQKQGIENLRVYKEDAVEVLEHAIADASLDQVQLFFPDPWHKKRHHKRRIVQENFVSLVEKKLKVGGYFHMATDWQPYAQHMLEVMGLFQGFNNCAGEGQFHPRPDYRPITKFEQRGQELGHGVWDLIFKRNLSEGMRS